MPFPTSVNLRNKAEKTFEITSFLGIDLSSSEADVDKRRSPNAVNMMPDSLGNPIKRTGFEKVGSFGAQINGCFAFGEHRIVHAGDKLYMDGAQIYSGMENGISTAQTIENKLYIFDGKAALCFDGNTVAKLCDIAYIPTVLISKNADTEERQTVLEADGVSTQFILEAVPLEVLSITVGGLNTEAEQNGEKIIFSAAPSKGAEIVITAVYKNEPGGSFNEEFNLLSSRWKESFICQSENNTEFTLSKTELSSGAVKAWVMNENGVFEEKTENSDFTVDRSLGKITFNSPVPKTPIFGEDNLIIEAEKDFPGYKDRINLCKKSVTFDMGGTSRRIFLCGNPNLPGQDFWCGVNDPTYFPDTYYSDLGGKILGYSVMEDCLGAHISPALEGRSVVLRKGEIDSNGRVSFPIIKHLQGEEAVSPHSFVYMEMEPLFLTKRGVYAITSEDILGEKVTQNRSFYINKALCSEEELLNAYCAKWKQFYLISVSGKLYLLDTGTRDYGRGEPHSGFQYECYLWNGFDARILWEENGVLYFGDSLGDIYKFKEDSYNDDGKPINAFWTFPDFCGEHFWKNKSLKTAAIKAEAFPLNKIRLEFKQESKWEVLKEWTDKISFFSWENFSWKNFTWRTDSSPRTLTVKTKIKKADKVGFRIVCDEKDKAFGLCGFALVFTEGNRFKK